MAAAHLHASGFPDATLVQVRWWWGKLRGSSEVVWHHPLGSLVFIPFHVPPSSPQIYTGKIADVGPRRPFGGQAICRKVCENIFIDSVHSGSMAVLPLDGGI